MINRIFRIKLSGGSELSMSQSEKSSAELSPKNEPPPVPEPAPSDLPQNVSLTTDQIQAVRELIQAEKANAYLWEYRYLNYFLAMGTQRVLDWLVTLKQRSNVRFYDSFWSPFITSAVERQAILNALQQHHLITITDDLIEVAEKGREYIQWRGPLPPAVSPTAS